MKDNTNTDERAILSRRKRRLFLWFVVGFLIVFVGMSITITMYSMNPSGDAVVRHKLWRYYLIEFERASNSSNTIGPASGSGSAAITTAFQHLLCSVAGGLVMMAAGWVFYKVKGDRRTSG